MSVLVARRISVAPFLLGAALLAWLITIDRMRGMDGGPGTDLGGLGWYVGIWVTMMGAMILLSVFPMVLLFGRVSSVGGGRGEPVVLTLGVLAPYLAVWTVYGLGSYCPYRPVQIYD